MRPFGPAALVFSFVLACGSEPQADAPPTSRGSVDATRLVEVYNGFSFGNCQSGDDCPRVFAKAAGVDLGASGKQPAANPRRSMKSPDPAWIPEWDRLPGDEAGAHYAYEALALAAVQRSWAASCDAAYAAHEKSIDEELATLDRGIAEKNRDPNPYDRLAGLLALEPAQPKKGALGEFVAGSDAVRYRWEAAVFEAFEDTARTFVYTFDAYAPDDALLETMRPRQPRAYERDAFCLDASRGAIANVKPLPDTSAWDADVRGMVRFAVPAERAKEIAERRRQLSVQVRAKFAKTKIPDPKLPTGIREITLDRVTAFERDGKRATVTAVSTREEKSGAKTVKIDDTATAAFADWPSGVILAPGDAVSFYGAEVRVKDTVIRSTPELEHLSRASALEAKHVTKIVTKGQTKKYFR